jgi:hypothetical protein
MFSAHVPCMLSISTAPPTCLFLVVSKVVFVLKFSTGSREVI